MSKPTGQKFTITSLNDIFHLPDVEMMKRCLKQTMDMMVTTRNSLDLISAATKVVAEGEGMDLGDQPLIQFKWPESIEWIDDEEESQIRINESTSGKTMVTVGINHEERTVSLNGVPIPSPAETATEHPAQ